ncbi:iron complex transport system ATP-binding protein [Seinonella peptonophila]|uniref:Iron complex transport system ATP-binding protein n=1 Tax=Seinonella peptonophila TaxID=112248 RepID=A0A1M4TV32_9BACL|nr:ABC transporter ATP-binding protein [Seinonella peptonophila]SHE48254.1 iron complex transport system ATP-binding protein [Seinonella peptonophila]
MSKRRLFLDQVSWKREERWILKQITWDVQENEHWAIVGRNGAGKTTLLQMITGYLWPTKGRVEVLGARFGEVEIQKVRQRIGWVSSSLQQQLHAQDRVLSIVLSGKYGSLRLYDQIEKQDEQTALELLDMFGLTPLSSQSYGTLSQGERQKVLISRAMMANPEILIFDEPCTGLDILAREQVLKMIKRIAQQPNPPTMIYVTHHIEEIASCFGHTLLLKDGQAAKSGPTAEVLTSDGLSQFFEVPLVVDHEQNRFWIRLGANVL